NLNGSFAQKEVLIPDLPTGGHVTRTIKIGPDQKIYLSTGSSCNVCEESDNRRAAIVRYNLDGTGPEVYASGLRNSVGMQFARAADNGDWVLWTVDNGRDRIGDDIPPEEVNIIGEFGLDFGWPYCYGDQIPNPEFTDRAEYCTQNTVLPSYSLQAHSAPLGITFTPYAFGSRTDFPEYLTSYAFITYHGSWNRSVPTGYKVVMINSLEIGSAAQDFITGWLDENGESWGRPVDIGFGPDGNMYISDDKAGVIYRVSVAGN
ncbi:PQQ-dependent sugar dehydrogenase, partial [Candidatus Dojkabacteria bacterium]|nr:PQQ-dependent sugar dehydrogenase [Candidatus Dojkabacteria bacterium]